MPRVAVVVVMPNSMAVRSILDTPVQLFMAECRSIEWLLLSSNDVGTSRIAAQAENIRWCSIDYPIGKVSKSLGYICHSITLRALKLFGADFGNLVFRFNHINNFSGHRFKRGMTRERKAREGKAGNFVEAKYGFPWPGSRFMFQCLYRLYHTRWQCNNPNVEAFYKSKQPAATVLWHVQDAKSKAFALASYKRKIPILGILGSWDRPTTKGPLSPFIDRYIVNSKVMKSELNSFHGVDYEKIENVGWPQIDKLVTTPVNQTRDDFVRGHHLDPGRCLLVYAANSARLGAHEPSIVEYIVNEIENHGFCKPCSLLIRAHPQDSDWEHRFARFRKHRNIVVQSPQIGNIEYLACLLRHADIIISTQGSITLDSVAVDACVINIAFDGGMTPEPEESAKLWYEMDHYRPVVDSGGVWIARNFEDLKQAINDYLSNPKLHQKQRGDLRELELTPLDGNASERTINTIQALAYRLGRSPAVNANTVAI